MTQRAKWHQVLTEVGATLAGHADLIAVYGSNVRLYSSASEHGVPRLTYGLLGDAEQEVMNPMTIQIDQWCNTLDDLSASEVTIRRLFDQPIPAEFGTVTMWAEFSDMATLADPDQDGYFGSAVRFRLTPLRDRYDPAPATS